MIVRYTLYFLFIITIIFLFIYIYNYIKENYKFLKANYYYEKEQLNYNKNILAPNKTSLNYININKVKKPLKCCILLTMYIGNDKYRKNMYENIVDKWLKYTNFEIFSVDSSGKYLNNKSKRLYQYSFKQNKPFQNENPSVFEKDSILNILKYYKHIFKKFDIIFKVTGKYFIKDLENIIPYIPNDADIILQNQNNTHKQNSELVGIKTNIIEEILNLINNKKGFEEILFSTIIDNKYINYKLPPLKIKNNIKRGDNSILKYL